MKYFDLLKEWQRLRFKVKDNLDQEAEIRDLCAVPKKLISNGMSGGVSVPLQERYIEQIDDLLTQRAILMKNLKMARALLVDTLVKEIDDYTIQTVMQMVMFRTTSQPNWQAIADKIAYSRNSAMRLYDIGKTIMEAIHVEFHPVQ